MTFSRFLFLEAIIILFLFWLLIGKFLPTPETML